MSHTYLSVKLPSLEYSKKSYEASAPGSIGGSRDRPSSLLAPLPVLLPVLLLLLEDRLLDRLLPTDRALRDRDAVKVLGPPALPLGCADTHTSTHTHTCQSPLHTYKAHKGVTNGAGRQQAQSEL